LVGSPEVMAVQLTRLREMARHPYVSVQVLPFSAAGSAGSLPPFVLASFADEDRPDMAYAEDAFSGRMTEERPEVRRLGLMWDALAREALRPRESSELIAEAAATWTS